MYLLGAALVNVLEFAHGRLYFVETTKFVDDVQIWLHAKLEVLFKLGLLEVLGFALFDFVWLSYARIHVKLLVYFQGLEAEVLVKSGLTFLHDREFVDVCLV